MGKDRVPEPDSAKAPPVQPLDPADYFYAWYATRYGKTPLTGARLSVDLFTSFLSDHLRSGCTSPSVEQLLSTLPVIWVGLRDLPKAKDVAAKALRRAQLLERWEERTSRHGHTVQPKLFDEV